MIVRVIALTSAIFLFSAGLARAADDSRAMDAGKKAFDQGVAQFRKGDPEGARISFAQSYAAYPSVETLRNLAVAELNTDHVLEALAHFKQYAKDKAADPEFVKGHIPALIARCNQRVGHLRIEASADASVTVDQRPVRDLAEPVDVLPGEHVVDAHWGSSSDTKSVRVGAEQTVTVSFSAAAPATAVAQGPATVATPPSVAAPSPGAASSMPPAISSDQASPDRPRSTWWTTPHIWAVGLGGVALVGIAVGVGSYAAGQSNGDDANTLRNGPIGSCSQVPLSSGCAELQDKIDANKRDAAIAGVSFAIAGVAAAGAVGLLLFAEPRTPPAGSVRWVPTFGPGTAGVVGSF
jgi:hypothetical protein